MPLNSGQCFFIAIVFFAVLGLMRGWRRELVSLVFTLAAILIVYLGGGTVMANIVFRRIPLLMQDPNNPQPPGPPTSFQVTIVTILTFIVLIALGYYIGNKAFPRPTTPGERVFGVILGIITGIAIYSSLSQLNSLVGTGPVLTLSLPTPSSSIVGNSLFLIFIVLVVLVIIGLVTTRAKRGGGAKK